MTDHQTILRVQIHTPLCSLAAKLAGSDLGSFLMIYRNWVSVFLVKKSVFRIKNRLQKPVILIKNLPQKSVFIIKNRSSKMGLPYRKSDFFFENVDLSRLNPIFFPKFGLSRLKSFFVAKFRLSRLNPICVDRAKIVPKSLFAGC